MVDAIFLLSELFGVAVHLSSRAHPLHAREATPFPEGPPLSFRVILCGGAGYSPAPPREILQERTKRSRHKSTPFLCGCPRQTQTVSLIHYSSRMFFYSPHLHIMGILHFIPYIFQQVSVNTCRLIKLILRRKRPCLHGIIK